MFVLAHGILPCALDLPVVEIVTIGIPLAFVALKNLLGKILK